MPNSTGDKTQTAPLEKKDTDEETPPSIGDVIDSFLHRILDIEDSGRKFITIAIKHYNENTLRLKSDMEKCKELTEDENDREKLLIAVKTIRKCTREFDRHKNSDPVKTLEKSLFIYLFAAFDKYIGDLISALYNANNALYKNINREVPLSEALTYETMAELRHAVLEKEIETLRRKSYVEQFSDLERKFSIALTKFESWPLFIEISQRRNLFTHCDGVVSKQYLEACKAAGYKFENEPAIGDKLEIGATYFYRSCSLAIEVAVMLGQTLWRKLLPKDLENSDNHLNKLIFDFLHMEHWNKSICLSKFALSLPKVSSDQTERIISVNYAIALKAKGDLAAALNILNKKDWSATSYDFKLAYAVLSEDYENAKKLMGKIGQDGELIGEMAYHDWPLFRDFRDRQEFFDGYETVYSYKYITKLSSIAEEKSAEASKSSELIEN